jgi:hypothetical protein
MQDFYSCIRPVMQNYYFHPEHRKQEIDEITTAFEKYSRLKATHYRMFHNINIATMFDEVSINQSVMKSSQKAIARPRTSSLNEMISNNVEQSIIKKEINQTFSPPTAPKKRKRLEMISDIHTEAYTGKNIHFDEMDESSSSTGSSIQNELYSLPNTLSKSETLKTDNEDGEESRTKESNFCESVISQSNKLYETKFSKDINDNKRIKTNHRVLTERFDNKQVGKHSSNTALEPSPTTQTSEFMCIFESTPTERNDKIPLNVKETTLNGPIKEAVVINDGYNENTENNQENNSASCPNDSYSVSCTQPIEKLSKYSRKIEDKTSNLHVFKPLNINESALKEVSEEISNENLKVKFNHSFNNSIQDSTTKSSSRTCNLINHLCDDQSQGKICYVWKVSPHETCNQMPLDGRDDANKKRRAEVIAVGKGLHRFREVGIYKFGY